MLCALWGLQRPDWAGLQERLLDDFTLMYRRLEEGRRLVPPRRFVEVRYEDLVRDPQHWGQALVAFLGREFDGRVRRSVGRAFSGSVAIGRRNQPPERIRDAEAIAGSLLRELGYDLQSDLTRAAPVTVPAGSSAR